METHPSLKKIEKLSIFNVSLNRLSLILQEENNIRQMFNNLTLNYLRLNKTENQPLNLTIINSDIEIFHQSMQLILWQIQCDQLISSFELSFSLKVNTVENTTLVSVIITLIDQSVMTKYIVDETLSMASGIINHITSLLNKDEYYRSQIESVIMAVPRKVIWDYITQWKYIFTENSKCFEVKFTNRPCTKGSIIQFIDIDNILRVYKVTLSDDDDNNSQWFYNLLLDESQSSLFQQIKFVFTLIEDNITLLSLENCFDQNVSSEALKRMKQDKKMMLEDIKSFLECNH